jgi:hypothetical protein
MIPFVMMTDNRGQRISVNPEIVQFVRTADNSDNECARHVGRGYRSVAAGINAHRIENPRHPRRIARTTGMALRRGIKGCGFWFEGRSAAVTLQLTCRIRPKQPSKLFLYSLAMMPVRLAARINLWAVESLWKT